MKKLSKLLSAAVKINETARINNYPLIPSYLRFYQLATSEQYSPVEIFMEDLLNPCWSDEDRAGMISKESFLRLQESVNPRPYRYLTEDKIAFHHFCIKKGLPIPELVAVYDSRKKSYWEDGTPIHSKEDFLNGLARYPFGIIAKPVHGAHGDGVICLAFVNGKHHPVNHADRTLVESLSNIFAPQSDAYILQKMLYSHKAIADFTSNATLQGLRLITCLDESDQPKLAIRKLKLPRKGDIIDNFSWGVNQGRQCVVDENGFITSTAIYEHKKKHVIRLDYVEDAAGNRVPFRVPMWEQCVALVLDAQQAFAPLRTIGWDVAVTGNGPVLIEGNVFWDPLMPQEGSMREICALLTKMGSVTV